jgi:hypothetical protein
MASVVAPEKQQPSSQTEGRYKEELSGVANLPLEEARRGRGADWAAAAVRQSKAGRRRQSWPPLRGSCSPGEGVTRPDANFQPTRQEGDCCPALEGSLVQLQVKTRRYGETEQGQVRLNLRLCIPISPTPASSSASCPAYCLHHCKRTAGQRHHLCAGGLCWGAGGCSEQAD